MTVAQPTALENADPFDLRGQRAVVTGASRGIGRAIALGFAARGASVFAVARSAPGLAETARLADEFDGRLATGQADLSQPDEVEALIANVVEDLGGVDILVNNAGYDNELSLQDTTPEEWQSVMDINVGSIYRLCRTAAPYLLDRGGKVINVASMFGIVGMRDEFSYVTSKHAVVGLTKALALEWARKDVQVNALCPGFVETDMLASATSDEASARFMKRRTPMGRWAQADEMVAPAVFLASAASSFMTGQTLVVDGGYTVQ